MLALYLHAGTLRRAILASIRSVARRRGNTTPVAPSTAGQSGDPIAAGARVHHLFLLGTRKIHGRELARRNCRVVGAGQSRVPIDRHDVAGQPSGIDRTGVACHGVLGTLLLGPRLEPLHATPGAVDGGVRTCGNRALYGDDYFWGCHDLRQSGFPFPSDRPPLVRPARQPFRATFRRLQVGGYAA